MLESLKQTWAYGTVEIQNDLMYVIGTKTDPNWGNFFSKNLEVYNITDQTSTLFSA